MGTEGCKLSYQTAEFSLLKLAAITKNVTVSCTDEKTHQEKDALHFDTITADVSLRRILSLIVTLNEVKLSNGYAKGVSPKSATYKFIDYVSQPTSPEREKQTRIRLKLISLIVENSKIYEDLGNNLLVGEGVSLGLSYDEHHDAILKPRIETLTFYSRGKTTSQLPLGTATGDVKITDTATELHGLKLKKDANTVTMDSQELTNTPNSLSGNGTFAFGLEYLGIPDWLAAKIEGNFTTTGSLGSPILSGAFSTSAGTNPATRNVAFITNSNQ